jgi:hypothetical protein
MGLPHAAYFQSSLAELTIFEISEKKFKALFPIKSLKMTEKQNLK